MAQLPDIIRAEADTWWIILFIIVGIVKFIQFIADAKKTTAKPPQATEGAEDSEKRNELEDLLSGLTQTLKGKTVFEEEPPFPPSIASKMESDEKPAPSTPKPRQPIPRQKPTLKHKQASRTREVREVKKAKQAYSRLIGNVKTMDIVDAGAKNKHRPANRLFPPISLLNTSVNFQPSPLARMNTRRELKRALVAREIFGPARALEPYGMNKHY